MINLNELALVEEAYRKGLCLPENCESSLYGVLNDTLQHPGGLKRAQLIFRMLRNFGTTVETALAAAIAIEYFHTASLLLDDLPCMDDAITRRGQLCPHRVYGEAAAILGALVFINKGYALIWSVIGALPADQNRKASVLLEECLGVMGVINGQSLDLHFGSSEKNEAQVAAIAEGKTGTMLRLALLLPCYMLGLGVGTEILLETVAKNWGLAYQTLDDFKDLYETTAGKTAGRDQLFDRPNMAVCVGPEQALANVNQQLANSHDQLEQLFLQSHNWRFLRSMQEHLELEKERLEQLAQAA